jgi:hypothetical protein
MAAFPADPSEICPDGRDALHNGSQPHRQLLQQPRPVLRVALPEPQADSGNASIEDCDREHAIKTRGLGKTELSSLVKQGS